MSSTDTALLAGPVISYRAQKFRYHLMHAVPLGQLCRLLTPHATASFQLKPHGNILITIVKRWYPCVFLSHLPKLSHWLWFVHRRTRLFLRLLRTACQCYHYSIARGAADSKHNQLSNIVIMNTQWLRLIQECPPWISSYQPSTLQIKLQRRGGRMEEITIGTLPAAAHQRYFARVLLQRW